MIMSNTSEKRYNQQRNANTKRGNPKPRRRINPRTMLAGINGYDVIQLCQNPQIETQRARCHAVAGDPSDTTTTCCSFALPPIGHHDNHDDEEKWKCHKRVMLPNY